MPPKIRKSIAIAAGVCGILEILFGLGTTIGCFIFSGITSGVITPYWSGIPLIISGSIAVATWPTRNQCLLIASLVINIILIIILAISAALSALASAIWVIYISYLNEAKNGCVNAGNNCICDSHVINNVSCDDLNAIDALLRSFVAFSILGMITALALSIIGCMGLCCYKPEESSAAVNSNGQIVVITNSNQPQQQQQNGLPPNEKNGGPYPDNGLITYQPPAY